MSRRSGTREGSASPDGRGGAASTITARARRLLHRVDVRFAIAAVAVLAAAVLFQLPASSLHARSRLRSAGFGRPSPRLRSASVAAAKEGGDGRDEGEGAQGGGNQPDWSDIDLMRQTFAMYLPRTRSLHYFWLGNDGLAAAYTWIRAPGYVSREWKQKDRKFEWLRKLYGTTVELDPRWEGACVVGARVLAAVGRDPSGSLDLLAKGMVENPDSWRLPYEAGQVCLLSPGRARDAARYFRMADLRPGRPDFIRRIIARLYEEAGQLDLAIRYARDLAAKHEGRPLGEAAKEVLKELAARACERLLNAAVEGFSARHGRPPSSVADLRRAGSMAAFDRFWAEEHVLYKAEHEQLVISAQTGASDPSRATDVKSLVASGFLNAAVLRGTFPAPERADPLGKRWLISAPTGTVRSEGHAEITVPRVCAVLQTASNLFKRREGRLAASLDEIARYFGEWTRAGRQLDQQVTELLKSGTAPGHPLAAWGERYLYDPATGKVDATWSSFTKPLPQSMPIKQRTPDTGGTARQSNPSQGVLCVLCALCGRGCFRQPLLETAP